MSRDHARLVRDTKLFEGFRGRLERRRVHPPHSPPRGLGRPDPRGGAVNRFSDVRAMRPALLIAIGLLLLTGTWAFWMDQLQGSIATFQPIV